MKFSELLPIGNQIIEDSKQLFIASNDFSFNGLPILKDSLVHVDQEKISVNIMSMSALDAIYRETYGLNAILPKEDNMWYLVEKESGCAKEATKLPDDGECIWHKNHFDRYRSRSIYLNTRLKKANPHLNIMASSLVVYFISIILNLVVLPGSSI
jgi:hypothetical protein